MSQQAESGESALPLPAKRWRVHKRTIVVVFCVVLLPWILIAIPGTDVGGAGTTGLNISHHQHGWPWVHLESTEYDISGNWFNGKFFPGQMPLGLDLAESAKKAAASFTEDKSPVQLNLRLERDDANAEWLGEYGYWSDISNWPVWKLGTHYTPRYLGLGLNLISLGLLAWGIAALCEYQIRRHHRLLRFSLANLLTGMALLGVATAWIVHMYHENAAEIRIKDSLQTLYDRDAELAYFQVDYEARFPPIVSQLLNHGMHPWGAEPIFRKVKSGRIEFRLDSDNDPETIRKITKLATQTQYSVHLNVIDFCPQRQRMLHSLDGINVETMYLDFDSYDWLSDEFGDEQTDGQWEQARKRAGFKVDLDIDMSELKELRLDLDWTISQADQLRQFMGLPSLEEASISGLTAEGAEFILKTKSRWPKAMEFYYSDDVSEKLRQELESEFDADLIGGFF